MRSISILLIVFFILPSCLYDLVSGAAKKKSSNIIKVPTGQPSPPPAKKAPVRKDKDPDVKCDKMKPCHIETFPTGDRPRSAIPDATKKILMEWNPKADSSNSVAMFMHEVGFIYGKHYEGFSHTFHRQHYVPKCGEKNVCIYFDPSWFRFKIVRNPYERAVSSYLHCIRNHLMPKEIFPNNTAIESLSFYDFLKWIQPLPFYEKYCDGHFQLQTSIYERYCYQHNIQLFHEIVKSEDPNPTLSRINQLKKTHYQLINSSYAQNFSKKRHEIKKTEDKQEFVGDIPFIKLKESIPLYGWFYNQTIKDLVRSIYYPDILVYNYSFPFPELQLQDSLLSPWWLMDIQDQTAVWRPRPMK